MAELKGDELILYGFKRIIEELKVIEQQLERIQLTEALIRSDLYFNADNNGKNENNGGSEK